MRLAFPVSLLIVLASCADGVSPYPRPAGEPFDPPGWYRTLYADIEECTGVTRPFDDVHWYVVPGGSWESTANGAVVRGEWWPPNDIYLAEGWADLEDVVAHEVLHYVIQDRMHPVPPFDVCAPTRI